MYEKDFKEIDRMRKGLGHLRNIFTRAAEGGDYRDSEFEHGPFNFKDPDDAPVAYLSTRPNALARAAYDIVRNCRTRVATCLERVRFAELVRMGADERLSKVLDRDMLVAADLADSLVLEAINQADTNENYMPEQTLEERQSMSGDFQRIALAFRGRRSVERPKSYAADMEGTAKRLARISARQGRQALTHAVLYSKLGRMELQSAFLLHTSMAQFFPSDRDLWEQKEVAHLIEARKAIFIADREIALGEEYFLNARASREASSPQGMIPHPVGSG